MTGFEETLNFNGEKEYPSLTKIEILEFIKDLYAGEIGIITLEKPNIQIYGTILTQQEEGSCILDEEEYGGCDDFNEGVNSYNILLADMRGISINRLEGVSKYTYSKKRYFDYIRDKSLAFLDLKLNLCTDLSVENCKWFASLYLVKRLKPNNLFSTILEHMFDEFEKEKSLL